VTDDQLVAAYLRRLRRAARGLPRARRKELLDEIADHIAQARAAGAAPLPDVLGALGDPEEIAAAAGPSRGARLGVAGAAAIALLLFGGFIFLVGWFAGLVLLWVSPRWRWPDKLLGTLVWPGGYAAFLLLGVLGATSGPVEVCGGRAGQPTVCTSTGAGGMPGWLGVLLLVITVLAPAAMAIRLVYSAQRVAGNAEPLLPEPMHG
jgi:hypothetical protein